MADLCLTYEFNARSLLDAAPDGVFVADANERIVYVNGEGCRIVGREPAEILAMRIFDMVPGCDAERLRATKQGMLEGRAQVGEWQLLHKDGHTVPVEINACIQPGGQWQGFARDITERKRLQEEAHQREQRLQQSEALFHAVFDLVPVGIFIAGDDGQSMQANAAASRIWEGIRLVGPEGYGVYKAWWADTGEPLEAEDWAMARALRDGATSRSELTRIQCFDGTFKTVLNWAAPIRGKDGEISGAVGVNQNVTALVRTQEQLRLSVRDREHILAVVAHDLRNPLSTILMRAMLLQAKAAQMADAQGCSDAAAAIVADARRMAGLVDDLLAISVAGSASTMLKLEPVPAIDLLKLATRIAQPLADRAHVRLELKHECELTTVHVDADRMMRVFGNLLDNALKFTSAGGEVVMCAEPAPGGVLFSLANSGASVPTADIQRLFLPFWQAGREDRRGAGLGLSICRSIIEAHGGTVWAEPADGMRLKILFLIPRVHPQTEPTSPAQARAVGL